MLMFWSRSACKASIRLAHSKGTPRRWAARWSCSKRPSGSEPVSWKSRPTNVDLPWSTWPRMTILSCSVAAGGTETGAAALIASSHVPVPPQLLERPLTLLILRSARPLRHPRAAQFLHDLMHRARLRLDRERARVTPNAPVTLPLVIGEVERDDGHALTLDVLPDVQLRPVQQRMNPDVGPGLEVRLELIPQLRRLILHVPLHVLVARAEVTFLGPRRLLVAAGADDDAREVVLLEHRLERVLLQRAAALDPRRLAARVGTARPERLLIAAHYKPEE